MTLDIDVQSSESLMNQNDGSDNKKDTKKYPL